MEGEKAAASSWLTPVKGLKKGIWTVGSGVVGRVGYVGSGVVGGVSRVRSGVYGGVGKVVASASNSASQTKTADPTHTE